jgi:hypothetical protein
MKIYKIGASEGFEWVIPSCSDDFEHLQFDGRARAGSWIPIEMRSVNVDEYGRRREKSDFPACSGGDMLLVRQRGVDLLGDVLRVDGELLPLNCVDGEPLWTFNVTTLLDCLDERRSTLLRMPDSGKIIRVKVPVFRMEALAASTARVFKVTQMPRGLIYVTDEFANRVASLPLRGIEFKQVWAVD